MKTNLLNLHSAQRAPERVAPRLTWSLAPSATGRPTLRGTWDLPATVDAPTTPSLRTRRAEGVAA